MSDQPQQTGLLLVISGPSGVGKSMIKDAVNAQLDGQFSVSATTRQPRPGETHGEDYFFVDRAEFERMRDAGELLEWATVHGQLYGTPRGPVERAVAAGQLIILDIDVQGGIQIKRAKPDALAIFILPPSEPALLDRLRKRATDSEDEIQRRFANAKEEIAIGKQCGAYEHFVVNEEGKLDEAVAEVMGIVKARLA